MSRLSRFIAIARAAIVVATIAAPAAARADLAGFDGRWRVVAADPAPWVTPAPRAAALGMGVIIGPERVEGPDGFACPRTPTIEDRRTTLREESRAVRVETIRVIAAREGVRSDRVTVRQVVCGSGVVDYVRLENGAIVAFVDDVYYTLRKATDDERRTEDDVFLRRVDASFDCARAKSHRERVVCGWPDARDADGLMGADFRTLVDATTGPRRAALVAAQRAFNAHVDRLCGTNRPTPAAWAPREEIAACVARATLARSDHLGALAVATAGPIRIEPMARFDARVFPRAPGGGMVADAAAVQSASPVLVGASAATTAAFAAEVARRIETDEPLIMVRPDLRGSVARDFSVTLLTERFVSLLSIEKVDAGTRVADTKVAINFDLATGRPVDLGDIFDRSTEWRAAVLTAVKTYLGEREIPVGLVEPLLAGTDGFVWSFAPGHLTIRWREDWMAPTTEIGIPATALMAFVKETSPWRPGR